MTSSIEWVKGPIGVQSRNFSNERIYSMGWQARFPLIEGIKRTHPWIEAQAVGGRAAEVERCSHLAFGLGAGGFGDEVQRQFLATVVDESASPPTGASCVMEILLAHAGIRRTRYSFC